MNYTHSICMGVYIWKITITVLLKAFVFLICHRNTCYSNGTDMCIDIFYVFFSCILSILKIQKTVFWYFTQLLLCVLYLTWNIYSMCWVFCVVFGNRDTFNCTLANIPLRTKNACHVIKDHIMKLRGWGYLHCSPKNLLLPLHSNKRLRT